MTGCRIKNVKYKNVVPIKQPSIVPFVCQDTVQTIEMLLDSARRGEVRGIAWVTLHPEQAVGSGWSASMCQDVWRTVGGAEDLKHCFVSKVINHEQ